MLVKNIDRNYKNIFILTLGTGFSSVFPIAVMPILTRLYSPQVFGKFEIFSSSVVLLSALATLRLEYAFVLPNERNEALKILAAAVRNAITFCAILFAIIFVFHRDYFLLFPLFLCTYSLSEIGKKWLAREGDFKHVSGVRFVQTTISNGLRWGFGLLKFDIVGLILCNPLAQISSLLTIKDVWRIGTIANWKETVKKYRNFALANAPEAIVIGVKELSLPILLTTLYGSFWLGQYGLTLKILRAPIFIIGVALADVYYREFSSRRTDIPFIRSVIKNYSLLILIPFLIVMMVLPPMMGVVFGEKWTQAGFFVRCLSPVYFISFINLVFMDKIPILFNRQSHGMQISVVGEILSLGALFFCTWMQYGIETSFLSYAIVQGSAKLVYSIWCWRLIR